MENNKMLWGNPNNAVVAIFGINMAVYMFIKVAIIVFATTPNIANENTLSAIEDGLILQTNFDAFLSQPWSFFTHYFTHISFLALLSNMFWLGIFSYLTQQHIGNGTIFPAYLYAGTAAGVTAIVLGAVTPSSSFFITGAQTGILGLAGLLMATIPTKTVFSEIKTSFINIRFIVIAYITIILVTLPNLIDTISTRNIKLDTLFPFICYVIAFFIGYLYGKALQKGKDWGVWMHSLYDVFTGKNTIPTKEKKDLFYAADSTPYNKKLKLNEYNINAILDKINKSGINALNEEEKLILQKAKHL